MKWDKIKTLLEKYYSGESTLEEEEQLRLELRDPESLPEEIQADAEMFIMMNALASDKTDQDFTPEDEGKIVEIKPSNTSMDLSWTMRIAAGFSILVIGVFAGWFLGQNSGNSEELAQVQQDMNEMKQMMALSQLRNQSASDRIMATYEFKKLDSANDEILDALINAFNNDENANVKNAAADALYKFGNHDKVKKAFINGLSSQDDPVLQIKLIDMLVGLNEKRALPKLQEMMQGESQMKVVKQKAAQGMGKLL